MEYKELITDVEDAISLYERGTIETAGGVTFQVKQTVDQIGRYIQSKYMGGQYDKKTGKYKYFRNVGNFIVDLEWRAKNIDRKAIEATALDGDYVFSMVVNKELQLWMKENNFGKTIDDIQRKKSEYGSVIVKKTETDDELAIDVVPLSFFYFNPKDIENGVKIEKMEMTPLELRKKKGVWDDDEIENAIQLYNKVKTDWSFIEVLDIEGEFPNNYFDEDADEEETALYNVIVAQVDEKKFVLDYNELKESRYKHSARKLVEGRDFGVGVWEEVFEAQIAINEAVLAESEAMDLAGKVILKTNMKSNVPTAQALVNGEIVQMNDGEFLEPVSLTPSALPQWGKIVDDWFLNLQRDQSAYAGITGEEPKASTPFSSLALQAAQSASIFNKRRDDDGYFINEIIKDWVLPFLVKRINKEHELTASFSPMELKMIDKAIKTEARNNFIINAVLTDQSLMTVEDAMRDLEAELELKKNERTLKIPKGYITMEKIRRKLRFDITDEMSDSQRELNALATRLQSLPPEDPARKQIIDQLAEISGLSPASFEGTATQNTNPQTAAAQPEKIKQLLPKGSQ